jgi:diguanylate cyclase (GGDEF)-like protein
VLLDAVIAGRDVSLLAGRFDTALNNMPHGLCMVDLKGQIVVCNRRLRELSSLPENVTRRRLPVRALINESAAAAALSSERAERLALALESRLAGSADGEVLIDTEHQRMLAVTVNPMAEGGAVLLFEDVTDRQIAAAKIHQLARFDTLTGLPNRAFLHDQTEAALAALKRRGPFAILFVDLDDFKQVNDTLGHTCGDALLCAVADRLRSVVRGSDMVARFGGDEFVVLQYPLGDLDESAALAEQIVDVLGRAFQVNGHQIVVGASIGIAVAPRDGDSADLLLKNADMALYRVKLNGRGSWQFFEQGMDVKAHARRNLQLDLRNALAADAFKVHYQPLYNLRTKRIATCEALLRWPHPERGMVPAGEFIPIAEEMGLIVEIGRLVLRKACIECARWPNDVRVAVNLSAIQFRRDDKANSIREALRAAKLAPDRLEIEITESAFLDDSEVTRLWLDQLQDLGVRISLDDFGTGYSSLSYLHSFPLNKVKIDRSFLHGLQASSRSLSLLYGVARLSAELDLAVTVEGVETREQLALIARERSITEVQGFYIGRPCRPKRFAVCCFRRSRKWTGSPEPAARPRFGLPRQRPQGEQRRSSDGAALAAGAPAPPAWFEAKLQHDGMVIAGPIAGRAMHDLAGDDLDCRIGQDVVDADARALVAIDEIGRDRVAPPGRRNGIAETEFGEAGKHLPAAFDKSIDGLLGLAGEAAEGRNQLRAIDAVLRIDGVEIAAHQQGPGQRGDHGGKIKRLVFRTPLGVGMIGCHGQVPVRRAEHGNEATAIIDVELLRAGNGMLAQNGVAPGAIVKGGRLVAKSEKIAIVDGRAGVRAAKQRLV